MSIRDETKRELKVNKNNMATNSKRSSKKNKTSSSKLKSNFKNILPEGYKPSDKEEFMCDLQLLYFKKRLLDWKNEILAGTESTLNNLQTGTVNQPDIADRARLEAERSLELRTRDRQRKLLAKIDAALIRIEDGSYGYCLESGEPIGLKRLEARPIASLSLDAQERHEDMERSFRDD